MHFNEFNSYLIVYIYKHNGECSWENMEEPFIEISQDLNRALKFCEHLCPIRKHINADTSCNQTDAFEASKKLMRNIDKVRLLELLND